MTYATTLQPDLFSRAAALLQPIARKARELLQRNHATTSYLITDRGVVCEETIYSLRAEAGESVENFLARVYTTHKLSSGTRLELSAHDNRLTAKVVTRTEQREIADLTARVADLTAQIAVLTTHITEHDGVMR